MGRKIERSYSRDAQCTASHFIVCNATGQHTHTHVVEENGTHACVNDPRNSALSALGFRAKLFATRGRTHGVFLSVLLSLKRERSGSERARATDAQKTLKESPLCPTYDFSFRPPHCIRTLSNLSLWASLILRGIKIRNSLVKNSDRVCIYFTPDRK